MNIVKLGKKSTAKGARRWGQEYAIATPWKIQTIFFHYMVDLIATFSPCAFLQRFSLYGGGGGGRGA